MIENSLPCPCGSQAKFNDCCNQFISHQQTPSSAETLMRSRYSAYTLKDESYLLSTWHNSTRPQKLDLINDSTVWRGLKIIKAQKDNVEFVAYFSYKQKDVFFLYESSRFIKNEKWFYLQGDDFKTAQVSKNMNCPCKSGKKFKRCCEGINNN